MSVIHNLGLPRIGAHRELKRALESYWSGQTDIATLEATGRELRARHWETQAAAGANWVTVGDFAWYDHILEWTALLGVVPARFGQSEDESVGLDTIFRMARGRAPTGTPAPACEMTKWFDSNYHYIVPEIVPEQEFRLARNALFEQIIEAKAHGFACKPVIPGPLTWLWLAKGDAFDGGSGDERKLRLLDSLLSVYIDVLRGFERLGVEWVQIDEPILALDLPKPWATSYAKVFSALSSCGPKLLLASYFGSIEHNLSAIGRLPVQAIHIDLVRAPEQGGAVAAWLDREGILSAGIVDGRNVWRTDLDAACAVLRPLADELGDRLWLAPSCSLLHVPIDLDHESELDAELRSWLAFAKQKLQELELLSRLVDGESDARVLEAAALQRHAIETRRKSLRTHMPPVRERQRSAPEISRDRTPFPSRIGPQQKRLDLPLYPTTTIGSFPQTQEIRTARRDWKAGKLTDAAYERAMRAEIEAVIRFQERVGLDVLVHGEPERNDMVEYFGELLAGFAFTRNGWVQSYGSRCVKPPIIYGDVDRLAPMTVGWSAYAQSLTAKPVKGMLTGPVTLLQWSFVRDDQPRSETCLQLALALRDEIQELEEAGIKVIQLDEPAFREGLPLRRRDWSEYLAWAVDAFRLSTAGARDETQIHTHMCYSEFNDIIEAIAAMDADVITIETSRSNMELLAAFEGFNYPNDIGPGVYDIHSPNVPQIDWMLKLMGEASRRVSKDRLWVNPDCGLKTRSWPEAEAALSSMIDAARILREQA